jgi:hypothetical protein
MELPQHYNTWYKNNIHQSAEDLLTLGNKTCWRKNLKFQNMSSTTKAS